MAQGSITVRNAGAYVARFSVSFTLNGAPETENSGNFTAGVNKTLDIPAEAVHISVHCEVATGLIWNPWSTVFQRNYESPVTTCFKITGTTLAPHYEEVSC